VEPRSESRQPAGGRSKKAASKPGQHDFLKRNMRWAAARRLQATIDNAGNTSGLFPDLSSSDDDAKMGTAAAALLSGGKKGGQACGLLTVHKLVNWCH
jgi:hypothetical protein